MMLGIGLEQFWHRPSRQLGEFLCKVIMDEMQDGNMHIKLNFNIVDLVETPANIKST